jgi:hypothetical protein
VLEYLKKRYNAIKYLKLVFTISQIIKFYITCNEDYSTSTFDFSFRCSFANYSNRSTNSFARRCPLNSRYFCQYYNFSKLYCIEPICPTNKVFQPLTINTVNSCPTFPFPSYLPDLGNCPITNCGCKGRYVSIRAVAFAFGSSYVYWNTLLNYSSYSWPGSYYNYQQCTPSWGNGDSFLAHEHCDGTWSFQRKDGSFLSANRLYSRTDGCP